jgi:hypothetical protein
MKLLQFILFSGLLTSSLHADISWETENASRQAARVLMQSPVIFFGFEDPRLTDLEDTVRSSPNPFQMLQDLDGKRKKAYREACQTYEALLKERKELEGDMSAGVFEQLFEWHFDTELRVLNHKRELNSPDSPYGQKLLELHQKLAVLPKFYKKAPEGTIKPLARRKK